MFVEFEGASCKMEDDGHMEYTPRGTITINVDQIVGFYDHRILVPGNKIYVMETREEIEQKTRTAQK